MKRKNANDIMEWRLAEEWRRTQRKKTKLLIENH